MIDSLVATIIKASQNPNSSVAKDARLVARRFMRSVARIGDHPLHRTDPFFLRQHKCAVTHFAEFFVEEERRFITTPQMSSCFPGFTADRYRRVM